ncbi:hypothetical protein ACHAWF_016530 [Thalassiosira exigua]
MSSESDFSNGRHQSDESEEDPHEESSSLSRSDRGPFENSHLEGEGNHDDGSKDEALDDNKSVGSFQSPENAKYHPDWKDGLDPGADTLDLSDAKLDEIVAAEESSKSMEESLGTDNQQVASLCDQSDGGLDSGDGGQQGTSTLRKRQLSDSSSTKAKRKKDKKSSEVAIKREYDKFTRWMERESTGIPIEWDGPRDNILISADKIDADQEDRFIAFGKRMIEKNLRLGMKEGHARRLGFVLERLRGKGKTYAELFDETMMCFLPIKDGTRKETYDKKHCEICKAAGYLVSSDDHDCPYCEACFIDSGWKRECVEVEECTKHKGGDVDQGPMKSEAV